MKKIEDSNVEFEDVLKPLVNAMKVPQFRNACLVLFINKNFLNLSKDFGQIGIISCYGPLENIKDTIDFIKSNTQTELSLEVQKAFPKIRNFIDPIISATVGIFSVESESEKESLFVAKFIEKFESEEKMEKLLNSLMPYIGNSIKPISELFVANLYELYFERYKNVNFIIPNIGENVALLRKLNVLTPFLCISICSTCMNYEFKFSKSININENCPKCGSLWSILTIDEFTPSFSTLKKENIDLPVFISAYLKSNQFKPTKIYPNAKIGEFEFDVLIEETSTGIECKCYENPLIISDNSIKSEVGKINKQIRHYKELGLKKIVLITNLSCQNAEKFKNEMKNGLSDIIPTSIELEVLGLDLEVFYDFLEEEANKINEISSKDIEKEITNRIQKVNQTKDVLTSHNEDESEID